MTNLVIFSVEELYKLIHDEPVFDNKSQTLYMSQIVTKTVITIMNYIWV